MGGGRGHGEGDGLVKARAVHFVAPRRVEVREVALPDPGEGQLLVAAEWSGISSGTELLAYRGEIDPDLPLDETLGALAGTFAYPFRYGYSAVGRVVRPAGGFREGQLVFAFHPHQDRFVVDAGDAMAVDGPEARVATMYPMVETALQVCLDAAPRPGRWSSGRSRSRPGGPRPAVSGCRRWPPRPPPGRWPTPPAAAAPTWW